VSDSLALKFFVYDHLPESLKAIGRRFYELAHWLAAELPAGADRTEALRRLLQAKDAAMRARL